MRLHRPALLCALTVLTAVTVVTTTLPAAAEQRQPDKHSQIHKDLADITRNGAVGAQVRVTDRGDSWTARAGSARDRGTAPVPRGGVFRAGSTTKMFTAVVLLQLVGEGRVALDDPLSRYLPPGLVPNADRITVRMVLQHRSGLHDLARDLPQGEEFVRTRFRHHDPAALVRAAAAKPADFPPGTDYGYSNTNYAVAGLVIERITGRPYAAEVRRRITVPLGLRHTSVPGDSAILPGPHAHGYIKLADREDITELNPSMAGAAGQIVSTTGDLDKFLTALTSGKLLRPAEWREMNRTVATGEPGARYGLGLKHRKLSCGRTVVGHTGGIPGYATLAFTTPDRSRRMVLSANLADWPADPGIGAPLDKVLDDAFCD
ncbi:serine hydrolase domain-containing protein [Streptomyces sp. 8N114]|uniref:serine hydrolase domain-containing protein n=1 Tax=Streptomyces sp. 8N114 TaxID=3457419 RepID=UPI003FD5D600